MGGGSTNVSWRRDARWSEAVAVWQPNFVEKVKAELGIKALHRELEQTNGLDLGAVEDPNENFVQLVNTVPWHS
jgi:hypothetical protein